MMRTTVATRVAAAGAAVIIVAATVALLPPALAASTGNSLYVNPSTGSDTAPGTLARPLKSLQRALDLVTPGSTVHLEPGVYVGAVETVRSGTATEPITIEGPETGRVASKSYRAVLYGTGHVFAVQNSHYVLRGFSIDGQQALEAKMPISTWPTVISRLTAFKEAAAPYVQNDRLIYIDSGRSGVGVDGTVIDDMWLNGAGGECVRVRNDSTNTVIEDSTIQYCGLEGRHIPGVYRWHNGEGVYIGTSPKSTDLSNHDDDTTETTMVKDDDIRTFGSECVDVKENAHDNEVLDTYCADNAEPLSYAGSNLELRGYDNSVIGSRLVNSSGYGLKVATDNRSDPGGNSALDDIFAGSVGPEIYVEPGTANGPFCGDLMLVKRNAGLLSTSNTACRQ